MGTETLRPNGVGNETAIDKEFPLNDAHYTLVDDVNPDHGIGTLDDIVKVGSTCVYNPDAIDPADLKRDLYTLPASSGSGSISQIEVFVVIRTTGDNAKASIRIGGTTYDSSFLGGAGGAGYWHEESNVWATNPDTGSAWLWSAIDTLQIGLLIGGPASGDQWAACTQVYVVVTYTPQPPTVTIQAVTNIVTTTAKGHGNVTDLGGASVTEHGHCWDLEANPTPDTGDSKTTLGSKATTGTFTSDITGLTEGQTYAIRAYATNSYGTSYSSELTFVAGTAGALLYPIDPQTRVTSLIHHYDRGTYSLEVGLGEVIADFGIPEWLPKPRPSLPLGEGELVSPLPGDTPSLSNVIPTLTDYARWLASKTEAQILAIFGHPPSYSEWLAWIQRGG